MFVFCVLAFAAFVFVVCLCLLCGLCLLYFVFAVFVFSLGCVFDVFVFDGEGPLADNDLAQQILVLIREYAA